MLSIRQMMSLDGTTSVNLFQILEQSVQALKISAVDDAHLAAYYASILEHHLANLRPGIESNAAGNSAADAVNSKFHPQSRTYSQEDWNLVWIDPLSETDLFADFSVFDD
ncbi:hypothetical protein V8C35DRAFT_318688 [Trichoderma chlorosporum]